MGRIVLYILLGLLFIFGGLFLYGLYYKSQVEARFPPLGAFVDTEQARLHYVDEGSGQPVVLLHGASANLRDQLAGSFATLKKNYRVIAFDRPGHGYSERAKENGHDPAVQAAAIHEALQKLGIEKPIILGHSWSGALVTAYALDYGDALKGVIVLAGATHPWRGSTSWYNTLAMTPVVGPLFSHTLLAPFGEAMLPAAVIRNFKPNDPVEDYAEKAAIPLLFRPGQFKANAEDVALLKDALAEQSLRYGEISVPMIIMTGDADRTVSPQIHSYTLHEVVSTSQLQILEGVGHMPHHVSIDRITDAVDRLANGAVAEQGPRAD